MSKCSAFDSLYFYKCEINGAALFNVDCSTVLGWVNCGLTSDMARDVLSCISNWDYIENLDLSQNKFGEYPEWFYSWMWHSIFGCVSIGNLILSDNGFSEEWKQKIFSCFKKFTYVFL